MLNVQHHNILFLDPRDGEWSVQTADGEILSDLVALGANSGEIRSLGEQAYSLNTDK